MSETPRRYSAEELKAMADGFDRYGEGFVDSDPDLAPMLRQAAEDASCLEKMEKLRPECERAILDWDDLTPCEYCLKRMLDLLAR